MDRHSRTAVSFGLSLSLTLALGATGCRSTRSEVPPSKPFSSTGQPSAPLSFGSAPHQANGLSALGAGGGDGLPGQAANGAGQLGTPAPGSSTFGVPAGAAFGQPGTSGLANPSAAASSSTGLTAPGVSDPTTGIPQTGTGPTGPAAGIGVGRPGAGTAGTGGVQTPSPQPFN